MDDKKDLRIVPQVKDGEWPLKKEGDGTVHSHTARSLQERNAPKSIVKRFQEDYKEVAERDVAQWEGNRAQRSLLMASEELERLSHQMAALATEYGDPEDVTRRLIENEVATRIAKALREKNGPFQMAREAVAEWIEEGKWRKG